MPALGLLAVLAFGLLAASPCRALLVLAVDDPAQGAPGVAEVIVADDSGPGVPTAKGLTTHADAASPQPGTIALALPAPAPDVFTLFATSLSPFPSGLASLVYFFRIDNPAAGTLIISVTDTDYVLPAGDYLFEHRVGGGAPGTTDAWGALDTGNAPFTLGAVNVVHPQFPGPTFIADQTTPAALSGGAFSLSQQAEFVHSGVGTIAMSGIITVVGSCPCFSLQGPTPTYCFDVHGPTLNSWAYTFPSSFLQVTDGWCRNNAFFRLITPAEANGCHAALHARCAP